MQRRPVRSGGGPQGHLVLHDGEPCATAALEREADAFASEFLIPTASLVEYLSPTPSSRLTKQFVHAVAGRSALR
ncbi:ImmA/IrrE family metallo-endopeptidase [Nocardia uniformis]|uniref:ImmA/IrrE family metallo-endopeptidase n=1 Tax=Nocardia uniformis TaxID=53432 RepID=UPI003530FE0A